MGKGEMKRDAYIPTLRSVSSATTPKKNAKFPPLGKNAWLGNAGTVTRLSARQRGEEERSGSGENRYPRLGLKHVGGGGGAYLRSQHCRIDKRTYGGRVPERALLKPLRRPLKGEGFGSLSPILYQQERRFQYFWIYFCWWKNKGKVRV